MIIITMALIMTMITLVIVTLILVIIVLVKIYCSSGVTDRGNILEILYFIFQTLRKTAGKISNYQNDSVKQMPVDF